ncbi:hypothetical protein CC2G_002695 [Coprinopsis cinerea AmutBmut pab1-1]|nr:hypothetical protein CC2G_002695 [Coprinopsis cinerea AmutBmut pab1-1]
MGGKRIPSEIGAWTDVWVRVLSLSVGRVALGPAQQLEVPGQHTAHRSNRCVGISPPRKLKTSRWVVGRKKEESMTTAMEMAMAMAMARWAIGRCSMSRRTTASTDELI